MTRVDHLRLQSSESAIVMRDQAYEDVEMAKEEVMRGESPSQVASTAKRASGKQVIDAGCILLNILTTVTLLFLNKWYVC